MSALLDEIRQRLVEQFQLIAKGRDVPPGSRWRLEGLREAAVITGDADEPVLKELFRSLHEEILGETVESRLGEHWEHWHPFPQIPVFMGRAPVSPSTSD